MKIRRAKISVIETVDFSGDVFNLELESNSRSLNDDDLFWCDASSRIVTHNCFPKDINALITVATKLGVQPTVLSASWSKNIEVRRDCDWRKMDGRAVSKRN